MSTRMGERRISSPWCFLVDPFLLRNAAIFAVILIFAFGLLVNQCHAAVQVNPTTVDFGNVYLGSSATRDLTIKNSGSTAITLSEAYIASSAFVRSKLSLPLSIGAGKSVGIGITFAPTATGSRVGTIVIRTSVSNSTVSIPITGTGVRQTVSISPVSMNFHSVVVGSNAMQSATVMNTGTASVTISGDSISGKGFTLGGITVPMILASGKSTSFVVRFAPTSVATDSGTVSLTTNAAGGWLRMSVAGVGVAASRTLTATPSTVNFGNVSDGSSANATVAIKNTGNSSLSISKVTLSGAGFGATGLQSGEVLTAGETASLDVTFAPGTSGNASGTISVASTASNSPTTIALSGTGATSGKPYVTLSWSASTSSVVGYNVYRGTASGGPYSIKLTTSPVAALTFTDTVVQAGQTYYYVVTAVNASGAESGYSNPASAVVP